MGAEGTTIYPMNRESDDEPFVVGYMDLTDFECELGAAAGGNLVFPSIEDCRRVNADCIDACGIVEVEVRFRRVIRMPSREALCASCTPATDGETP